MSKKVADHQMKMMYHMGMYFDNRYSRRGYWNMMMTTMLNQNHGVYLVLTILVIHLLMSH